MHSVTVSNGWLQCVAAVGMSLSRAIPECFNDTDNMKHRANVLYT